MRPGAGSSDDRLTGELSASGTGCPSSVGVPTAPGVCAAAAAPGDAGVTAVTAVTAITGVSRGELRTTSVARAPVGECCV